MPGWTSATKFIVAICRTIDYPNDNPARLTQRNPAMVKEINPFSLTKVIGKQPIMDFRVTPAPPEYDPKETGASKVPVEEPLPTSAETPTSQITSSETDDGAASLESSSALSAQSPNSAGTSETSTESPTESGEEKTKPTERPEAPTSPRPPTSPKKTTLKSIPLPVKEIDFQ